MSVCCLPVSLLSPPTFLGSSGLMYAPRSNTSTSQSSLARKADRGSRKPLARSVEARTKILCWRTTSGACGLGAEVMSMVM